MAKDIYSRVSELVSDKKKRVTDKQVFESSEYKSWVRRKVENIITGSFYTLNKMGFNVSKYEEQKILRHLTVDVIYDPNDNKTAFSASTPDGRNHHLFFNTGNELVSLQADREDKHNAVAGLIYHEVGHLLFTDFPTMRAALNQLGRGIWFPKAPDNISTVNGINLSDKMTDEIFRKVLVECAASINNAIEDGYIERECIEMMPGRCKECLAVVNDSLYSTAKTLEEDVQDEDVTDFSALFGQILLYSKFNTMLLGEYDGELLDPIYESVDIIDKFRYERDPVKRFSATNELLCILFPYLEKDFEDIKDDIMNQQQNGNSGQSSSGQGGQGTASSSAAQQAADAMTKSMQNKAQQNGATSRNDNSMSRAVNNPTTASNAGAPAQQDSNAGGKGAVQGNQAQSNAHDAAKRDLDKLINDIVTGNAMAQAEEERTRQMDADAKDIDCSIFGSKEPVSVTVRRAARVSDENKASYDKNAGIFIGISRMLQRDIKNVLKDRREGGRRKNLPFGRRLEVSSIVHQDGKYFSKNKLPTEFPRLGVGLLVDESGSTSGQLIEAATAAALVIEDFCRELAIPHIINGYSSGPTIYSYCEPNEIDDGNRYRITGMSARGSTPTKSALLYMCDKMRKLPVDVKLLIVISDGQSDDNYDGNYYAKQDKDRPIARAIANAKKQDIIVVAAGIGSNKSDVEKEFGTDNFMDISNLNDMPEQLVRLIKANLVV